MPLPKCQIAKERGRGKPLPYGGMVNANVCVNGLALKDLHKE